MQSLATIFTVIMSTLQALISQQTWQNHARGELLGRVWSRAAEAATRFETLYARWQAGTLRPPRIRAPRPTPPGAETPPPAPTRIRLRLPTRRGWLAATHHNLRNVAGQLTHLLERPDAAEFLHAAPQLGRTLRPICHMLGIAPPPALRLPSRPPRPARPKPPRPAHTAPEPLLRPLQDYVLAAARAWNRKPA